MLMTPARFGPTRPLLARRASLPRLRGSVGERLNALEDCGNALADADTHRDQRISAAGAVQLPRRGQGDARARRAERMPDRDSAAIWVHATVVERDFEAAQTGEHL